VEQRIGVNGEIQQVTLAHRMRAAATGLLKTHFQDGRENKFRGN